MPRSISPLPLSALLWLTLAKSLSAPSMAVKFRDVRQSPHYFTRTCNRAYQLWYCKNKWPGRFDDRAVSGGSAGMLGIILAGGAYVPLDPAYPKERIGAIIESARLELAVSIPHLSMPCGCDRHGQLCNVSRLCFLVRQEILLRRRERIAIEVPRTARTTG